MEHFITEPDSDAVTNDIAFQLSTYGYNTVVEGNSLTVLNHDEHYMSISARIISELIDPFDDLEQF